MKVVCDLCMNYCRLEEGKYGNCKARKNINGEITAVNYGKISSMALDPIEKKPLYHFCPGSKILSIGSFGCNMRCPFCQNYEISMAEESGLEIEQYTPEDILKLAVKYVPMGNIGVAFTYNEPLIGYEFVIDTSILLKENSLKSVVVTNGAFTEKVATAVSQHSDAMNIDLKGFTKEYYKKLGGDLDMVMRFIEIAAQKCHIELTTLIVPGENDSKQEMIEMCKWIKQINPEIPLHISRFFPNYKYNDKKATKTEDIYSLVDNAKNYLKNVHTGNC